MTDIKSKVQGIDANLTARDLADLAKSANGNIYEALAIIHKRAKQLSVDIKQELHQKLDEFALSTEAIEEIHENKEQIEISKFYERMPNPTVIATHQYLNGEVNHRYASSGERVDEDED